jgi:Protein of unknown function (DUF1559)
MPITVSCPSCHAVLRAPDTAAGKKIRCPKCSGVTQVPATAISRASAETLPSSPALAKSTVRTRQTQGVEAPPAPTNDEDRPRARKRRQRAAASNNKLWLWLTLGGVAFGGIALVVVVILVFSGPTKVALDGDKKPPQLPVPHKPELLEEADPPEPQKKSNEVQQGNIQFPIWRTQSEQKLSQLAKAMHIFHSDHQWFPYAKSGAGRGKGQLSWRVAILPALGQLGFYNRFKLDEPWDSPHNKRILDDEGMPDVFAAPNYNPGEEKKTYYQIITGPKTLWPNDNARPRLPLPNGTSTTILIVEAKTPVYWTQPEDVVFDGNNIPPLGGVFAGNFHAAMGDASVRFVQRGEVSNDAILAMIAGGGGL